MIIHCGPISVKIKIKITLPDNIKSMDQCDTLKILNNWGENTITGDTCGHHRHGLWITHTAYNISIKHCRNKHQPHCQKLYKTI